MVRLLVAAIDHEEWQTCSVVLFRKASTVSELGTGPGPTGCLEQSPSRASRSSLLLPSTAAVSSGIGAADVVVSTVGLFVATSRGGFTMTGGGASSTSEISISSCAKQVGRRSATESKSQNMENILERSPGSDLESRLQRSNQATEAGRVKAP